MAQRSEEAKALRELLRTAVHFEKKTPKLQRIESQRQALREAITQAQLVLSLEKQAPFLPGISDVKDAAVGRKILKKRS